MPADPAVRREQMNRTFIELSSALVNGAFEVVPFLQTLSIRCVETFDLASAGVMLTDDQGRLQIVASSDDQVQTLQLLELQAQEGPCLDAFRLRAPVQATADEAAQAWPRFFSEAKSAGYRAFGAVPLRLGENTIGALNLFRNDETPLSPADVEDAQALSDIASISLFNGRALREAHVVAEQLRHALSSRIVIEQAKGVVATTLGIAVDAAFPLLRKYARDHNLTLGSVCQAVVAGEVIFDG